MELIYAFLLLLTSIPAGYLLKYLTKEEIKDGRKYFRLLCFASLFLAIGLLFIPFENYNINKSIIFTLLFIANVAFISWR